MDGVTYSINGVEKGVTANGGEFQYTLGDKVTFSLGALTLGEYTPKVAGEVVTPIELASSYSDTAVKNKVVTNLLILLQSLNDNDNSEDGITITAEITNNLDLTLGVEDFVLAVDSILPEDKTLVSAEEAVTHFKQQYFNNLAGVYYFDNYGSVLRINNDGNYLVGQFIDEENGALGVEWGQFNLIDIATGLIEVAVSQDFQDGAGFDGAKELRFTASNQALIIHVEEDGQLEEYRLHRLANETGNSIVGAWAVANTPEYNSDKSTEEGSIFNPLALENAEKLIHSTTQFVFFADGTYVMFDLVGDDHSQAEREAGLDPEDHCSVGGVQLGKYSYSNSILRILSNTTDTNKDCGMGVGAEIPVKTLNSSKMEWDLPDEYTAPFPLKRVITNVQ